jgi:hypothetical protein
MDGAATQEEDPTGLAWVNWYRYVHTWISISRSCLKKYYPRYICIQLTISVTAYKPGAGIINCV